MTTRTCVTSQTRFCRPHDIAYDAATQKLVVGTYGNRRVLVYNTVPVTDGAAADVVVDEINFTAVTSATDQSSVAQVVSLRVFDGKLFVSDGVKIVF